LDFFPPRGTDKLSDRYKLTFLDGADTILLGRKTCELFVDYRPTVTTDQEIIADRLNLLPKFVFSNARHDVPGESGARQEDWLYK
jgi:hypothetical protein